MIEINLITIKSGDDKMDELTQQVQLCPVYNKDMKTMEGTDCIKALTLQVADLKLAKGKHYSANAARYIECYGRARIDWDVCGKAYEWLRGELNGHRDED